MSRQFNETVWKRENEPTNQAQFSRQALQKQNSFQFPLHMYHELSGITLCDLLFCPFARTMWKRFKSIIGSSSGDDEEKRPEFTKPAFEQVLKEALGQGTSMDRWCPKRKKLKKVVLRLNVETGMLVCCRQKHGRESTRKMRRVAMVTVKEIRKGQLTKTFKEPSGWLKPREEFSFSVIYGPKYKTLDLICHTLEDAEKWTKDLQYVVDNMATHHGEHQYLRSVFNSADANGNGLLDNDEIRNVLKILNIHLRKSEVKNLCRQSAAVGDGTVLEFSEFVGLYRRLGKRKDLLTIFNKFSSQEGFMAPGQFESFLSTCQGGVGPKPPKLCQTDGGGGGGGKAEGDGLTFDDFVEYMMGMRLENEEHIGEVYQSMKRPLSDYWINSSHNTYLLGDQLVGESSVEGYIRRLQDGCRCVEVDSWDGDDGEPVVYHGHTLTSKVSFLDVIQSIGKYAFVKSVYPVIINIENHCSPPQQSRMAAIMKEELGDMLLAYPLVEMLSPDELKNKILIRSKKPKPKDVVQQEGSSGASDGSESESAEENTPVEYSEEYANIVNFVNTKTKLQAADLSNPPTATTSKSESKFLKLVDSHPQEAAAFIQGHLTRIYPGGSRVRSTNFDPRTYWAYGCQLVALNQQTKDVGMEFNRAMFLDNGGCGYVLKPERMFRKGWFPQKEQAPPAKLTVEVISGHRLPLDESDPKDIVDPYVVVEVFHGGVENGSMKERTHHVQDNGFNPYWGQTLKFSVIEKDTAFIQFRVMDYDTKTFDDFLGQSTIRMTNVLQGYRHISLYKESGDPIPLASLFVHISMQEKP